METEEVYMLTPSVWNPHCDTYTANEERMIYWEGNMIKKRNREKIFLSDIPEDNAMMVSIQILSSESSANDHVIHKSDHVLEEKVQPCWMNITRAADEVSSVLASVFQMINDETLYVGIRNKT